MNKIIIVTDSCATLPADLVRELDIRVVPFVLNLEGHSYRDGIDLTPNEFYLLLRTTKHVPTTSAPSIADFLSVYTAVAPEADGIVSIHLPPHLSATYDVALQASQMMDDIPIKVVNSQSATMAEGFVVLEAARMAASGANLDAVVACVEEMKAKVRFYVMLETLEYLRRGGRIGGAASLVGNALQIKPILTLVDGQVQAFARPHTHHKAVERILQAVADDAGGYPIHAAVMHADALPQAQALAQRVTEQFDCVELYMTEFTPVMGAHAGPGVLGVAFFVDDNAAN
jgi:DegV family protein with EDD domain